MRAGDSVNHPDLGLGTVVALLDRGGRRGAEVDFGYMSEWVSFDELGVAPPADDGAEDDVEPGSPLVSLTGSPAMQLPEDVLAARRGVLALKLGQILEENVLELSTGTDPIRERLEAAVADVARRQARSVLVKGSYGSGKTHLLTMLKRLASAEGLATASVILDGEAVALSDPMSLMEALLSSLRFPGEVAPEGISRRIAKLRRTERYSDLRSRVGPRIADALFAVSASAFDEPEVVEVLEAYLSLSLSASQARHRLRTLHHRSHALPSMKARSIDERAGRFCELLGGWAEVCCLSGAKGLLLIFDEVDVEYGSTVWRGGLHRRRAQLLGALDGLMDRQVPLMLAFASAPAGDDVAAEDDAVLDLTRQIGGVDLEVDVPQPSLADMRLLARRVYALYERAYPERMANVDRSKLRRLLDAYAEHHQRSFNAVPRLFVRGTLERLDVAPGLPSYRLED